jgi:quercetin dioxygenase-like cupin family protein
MALGARADMPVPPLIPQASVPKPVVTKLFSGTQTATSQPLTLPQGPVELTVLKYAIPPGAVLPVHKHPYPRYAYVLTGRLKVSTADGAHSFEYGPGDVVVEMLDAWHSGTPLGSESVTLLVIDQAPPGQGNTVVQSAGDR